MRANVCVTSVTYLCDRGCCHGAQRCADYTAETCAGFCERGPFPRSFHASTGRQLSRARRPPPL
eukprot:4989516-Alexandrium_andersonii.AAC.1